MCKRARIDGKSVEGQSEEEDRSDGPSTWRLRGREEAAATAAAVSERRRKAAACVEA